jgi:hypothetical protein
MGPCRIRCVTEKERIGAFWSRLSPEPDPQRNGDELQIGPGDVVVVAAQRNSHSPAKGEFSTLRVERRRSQQD